jgi:hypothetical protein
MEPGRATIHAMLCSKSVTQRNRSGEPSCHSSATCSAFSRAVAFGSILHYNAIRLRVRIRYARLLQGRCTCLSEGLRNVLIVHQESGPCSLCTSCPEHGARVTSRQREAEEQCGNVSTSLGFNKPLNQPDSIRVRRCTRNSGSRFSCAQVEC